RLAKASHRAKASSQKYSERFRGKVRPFGFPPRTDIRCFPDQSVRRTIDDEEPGSKRDSALTRGIPIQGLGRRGHRLGRLWRRVARLRSAREVESDIPEGSSLRLAHLSRGAGQGAEAR